MIYVIVGLALLITGVLVDWPKLLKRLPQRGSRSRLSAAPSSAAPDVPYRPEPAAAPPAAAPMYAPQVQAALDAGDVRLRKGELKAAEDEYLKAAADPRCVPAYVRLGEIYLQTGDSWDEAKQCFEQALKTEPDNGFALNNLGLVLYEQDRFADAIRRFEAAVRRDETVASRHANLGAAYMAMRQYAKAESAFKKALKLRPNEREYKDLLEEALEKKIAHKTMIRK